MNITLNRKSILTALGNMQEVPGDRSNIATGFLQIVADPINGLTLSRSSDTSSIFVSYEDAELIEKGGEAILNFQSLMETIDRMGGKEVKLEIKAMSAQLSSGRAIAKLTCIKGEIPKPKWPEGEVGLKCSSDELLNWLSDTSRASANNDSKRSLNGVCFRTMEIKEQKSLYIFGCDGRRFHVQNTGESNDDFDYLVANPEVSAIKRAIQDCPGLELKVEFSKSHIKVASDYLQFYASLPTAIPANMQPILEGKTMRDKITSFTADRIELLDTIKRASYYGRSESKVVRIIDSMRKIMVSAITDSGNEQFDDIVDGKIDKDFCIEIASGYMMDALSTLENKTVTVEVGSMVRIVENDFTVFVALCHPKEK